MDAGGPSGSGRRAIRDATIALAGGASSRNIVNRAYYACFYAAAALLLGQPNPPRKHSQVLSLLDREYVNRGLLDRRFSRILHDLFSLRNESDYRMTKSPPPENAAAALQSAREFVHAVRNAIKPLE